MNDEDRALAYARALGSCLGAMEAAVIMLHHVYGKRDLDKEWLAKTIAILKAAIAANSDPTGMRTETKEPAA